MRRLSVLLVLALALVALAIPALGATASAKTAAKTRSCEATFTEGRTARSLRVTSVSCDRGRAIATHVASAAPTGCVKFVDKKGHVKLVTPCTYREFKCTARRIVKGLALDVTCRRGAAVVRFQY